MDNFRLEYIGSIDDVNGFVSEGIKKLLIECDNEFVPPLSYRENTRAPLAEQRPQENDITQYFEHIMAQKNIVAYYNDAIVALMSFRHDYEERRFFPDVLKDNDIVNYVTTICVAKKYRNQHFASRLYNFIENIEGDLPKNVQSDFVATRTWATNNSHIKLLSKRGYSLTCTLHGDRNINNETKIDTVYYCKRVYNNLLTKNAIIDFKILLITTGGTIAQSHDTRGYTIQNERSNPFQTCIDGIVAQLNEHSFNNETHTIDRVDVVELLNKDSSNIIPDDWVNIINKIVDEYDNYNAFVVTHGTNTLGYTSSAISFALGRFGKPVVLTGSQVSFGVPASDAQMNLENAIRIAAYSKEKLAGVIVVFGSMIITGTRATKTTEFSYDAFMSFNYSSLGRIGNSVRIAREPLSSHLSFLGNLAKTRLELDVYKNFDARIASLIEFPGMDEGVFKALVESKESQVKGIIFQAFGAGDPNVSDENATFKNLRKGFEYLRDKEIPIIVTTQAADGIASMDLNTPGYIAYTLGAIPAKDMSVEAMTVKMMWLLGRNIPYDLMRVQMLTPFRGEIRL